MSSEAAASPVRPRRRASKAEPTIGLCIWFARPHDALPPELRQAMRDAGLQPHGEYEWIGRVHRQWSDQLGHDADYAEGVAIHTDTEKGEAAPPAPPRGPGLSHAELAKWREDAARRVAGTPPDVLGDAVDIYRDRFGAGCLPYTFGVPNIDVAFRMLLDAVERGQPVHGWQIMRSFGIGRPPVGACY